MKINLKDLRKNENGLVSIMVASLLMVVMALITLGFTRIVQNEQRQAIDNQLSKQAFYAAESGINIAASAPGFPGNVVVDECDVSQYGNGEVSNNGDVAFTCILINPEPDDLVFSNDSITSNRSKVVPIIPSGTIDEIIFEWGDINSDNVASNCGNTDNLVFDKKAEEWDKISPLRLDLYAITEGSIDRTELINSQFSAIFYPCNNTGSTTISYAAGRGSPDVGRIYPVNCQTTGQEYECSITINNVPDTISGSNVSRFYSRFNSVYRDINVRIKMEDSTGDQLLFSNAQAVVDSTGRAVDVFRRLQARVPLYDTYVTPNATIQTVNDICKLYDVKESSIDDNCLGP